MEKDSEISHWYCSHEDLNNDQSEAMLASHHRAFYQSSWSSIPSDENTTFWSSMSLTKYYYHVIVL